MFLAISHCYWLAFFGYHAHLCLTNTMANEVSSTPYFIPKLLGQDHILMDGLRIKPKDVLSGRTT